MIFLLLLLEKFYPYPVSQVRGDPNAPTIEAIIWFQLVPGVAFDPGARLIHIGDFDTDTDDLSVVAI
jgi:hypothetical protein